LPIRFYVPIVNIAPEETMITEVNIEDKPQTIAIPARPMLMPLNYNISARVCRGLGYRGRTEAQDGVHDRPGPDLVRRFTGTVPVRP
jgi:hypothetical protein